jgi:hypothetical protein
LPLEVEELSNVLQRSVERENNFFAFLFFHVPSLQVINPLLIFILFHFTYYPLLNLIDTRRPLQKITPGIF